MVNNKNNVAYIDGANLHKAALQLGWRLDYTRLRVWPFGGRILNIHLIN